MARLWSKILFHDGVNFREWWQVQEDEWMLPIILAIALLLGLIWWTRGRKVKNPRWGSNRTQESRFKQAIRASRSPSAKVSSKLRRDLIRIAGNPQVAERLVTNLRIKNPGKPENWYWEKAIFDLERDRHY